MRIMMHGYLDSKNNHEYYIGFPLDVTEDDTSYTVTADLPGVEKENIKVGFLDGVLTITAKKDYPKDHNKYLIHERSFMNMKREINFGDVEEDTISAKLNDGVLTIVIAKEPKRMEKTIEIQ
ncbi:Hsp20 family protein [Anaeroplasma bactoclasticum]|jgi:HSP20 family protein|nr:Hsp20 family protein [Anaeroplasma bactoclasticum]